MGYILSIKINSCGKEVELIEPNLYVDRFSDIELLKKKTFWNVLVKYFLQKYIPVDSIVLDVGSGYCEFINIVSAREKFAVDLNINARNFVNQDVKLIETTAEKITYIQDAYVDVVFCSNFFEHLNDRESLLRVLKEIKRILKDNGRFIIIQPNIKYVYREYWDYYDHNIPLSDVSMGEALRISGFDIKEIYPKFLPLSPKRFSVKFVFLLIIYLRCKLLWKLFGKQMFIVASKKLSP